MATVYLLQAEHFSNPGRITKIYASKAAADREAAKLVNIMLADTDEEDVEEYIELVGEKPAPCDGTNWAERMAWLTVVHEGECYVDVEAMEVIKSEFHVIIVWNDRDPEEGTYSDTVEAADAEEAEQIVREMMAGDDIYKRKDFRYGRLIECVEVAG